MRNRNRKTTMTGTSNPTPAERAERTPWSKASGKRVEIYLYAYGDNLMEVMEDLAAKAREFFGTLDGVEMKDKISCYGVSGNSTEWQKRAGGKSRYTYVTVTGPAPGFPPGTVLPVPLPEGFLFNTDDLRYALDVVHGGGYSEGTATGGGGSADFWYPKFEAAIRRRRATKLVAPEATDKPV